MSTPTLLRGTEIDAWRGLLRAHASLVKTLDRELDQAHGISLSSYEVLLILAQAEDSRMRMCGLADSVLLSRSGLTRLVDRLERAGFVVRDSCEQDARGSYAVITADGRRALDEARETHLAGVRTHFLDHFSAGELEQLATLWERIGADASNVPPCPQQ